jgi:hypothetical protein
LEEAREAAPLLLVLFWWEWQHWVALGPRSCSRSDSDVVVEGGPDNDEFCKLVTDNWRKAEKEVCGLVEELEPVEQLSSSASMICSLTGVKEKSLVPHSLCLSTYVGALAI